VLRATLARNGSAHVSPHAPADFKPLFDPGPPLPHLPFADRKPLDHGETTLTGVSAFLNKVSAAGSVRADARQ